MGRITEEIAGTLSSFFSSLTGVAKADKPRDRVRSSSTDFNNGGVDFLVNVMALPPGRLFQKITRDKRASLKAYAIDLVNIDSGEQFVIVFMPAKEFVSRQETTPLIE